MDPVEHAREVAAYRAWVESATPDHRIVWTGSLEEEYGCSRDGRPTRYVAPQAQLTRAEDVDLSACLARSREPRPQGGKAAPWRRLQATRDHTFQLTTLQSPAAPETGQQIVVRHGQSHQVARGCALRAGRRRPGHAHLVDRVAAPPSDRNGRLPYSVPQSGRTGSPSGRGSVPYRVVICPQSAHRRMPMDRS
jgi:hypothetical protein